MAPRPRPRPQIRISSETPASWTSSSRNAIAAQNKQTNVARTKCSNRFAFPVVRRLALWLAFGLPFGVLYLALGLTCANQHEFRKSSVGVFSLAFITTENVCKLKH